MKKFTLIELLVIMAIIGILFSILLPSLSKSKNTAEDVVCISNLSQISKGISVFASNNNGAFPAHKKSGKESWIESIYIDNYELFKCTRVESWKYNNGKEYSVNVSTDWNRAHLSSYGYNGFWLGLETYSKGFQGNPMPRNVTFFEDCVSPSEVIMNADSSPLDVGLWSSTLWYKWRKKDMGAKNEGVKPAHGYKQTKANIIFVDGHASAYDAYSVNFDDTNFKDWWNPNPLDYPVNF